MSTPGLTLVHSNRSERLLDRLAHRLESDGRHALEAATLVVPNTNVETYLRLGLSERLGVAAGIDFLRLETLAAKAAGHLREVQIVGRSELQAGLLALFHDEAKMGATEISPELSPVRAYLAGAAGAEPGAADLRRVQLSDRVAALLEGYQWSRPELLWGWLRGSGTRAPDPALDPALAWQATLFRLLLGPGGLLCTAPADPAAPDPDPAALPRMALVSRLLDPEVELDLSELLGDEGALHLFGLSTFGRLFHHLLARLARRWPVVVYLLNPSQAYWDDLVVRGPAIAKLEGDDPLGFSEQPCVALSRWGKAGGEHLRLLHELSGGPETLEEEAYQTPEGTSLLARVQQDLLLALGPDEQAPFEEGPKQGDKADPPPSLLALACPSLRREVEAVADRIWSTLAASGGVRPLRFHEIAVLVPPSARDRYLPMIAQVFGAHHHLPHTTADLSFLAGSPLAEATALLCELPFGRFGRGELLRLLSHPAFDQAAALGAGGGAGSGAVDVSRFAALAEAAGIYFGRDDDDLADTYLGRDCVHWAQGLTRLALGQALGGARAGEPALAYEHDGRQLLPEDLGVSDPQTVRAFGLLATSLIADLRVLREGHAPLGVWADRLRRLVDAYLRVEGEADARDRLRVLGAIDTLRDLELDLLGSEPSPVSGRTACALLGRALAGLSQQAGPYLAEGVVVSTFQPLRAIPFRAIFVLGLGEGVFPGPARRDPLDLRATRRAGDLTPAERDRQAFLETLLSARERLILSWVHRDETTGDLLAPSSLLLDLLDLLRPLLPEPTLRLPRRGSDGQITSGSFFERVPLRRRDDPHTSLPEGQAEQEIARFGEALGLIPGDPPGALLTKPGPDETRKLAALLRLPALTLMYEADLPQASSETPSSEAPSTPQPPSTRALQSQDLRRFLDSPLQGAARLRLRLREGDDTGAEDVEDEPVETSSLQTYLWRREALEHLLRELPWSREAAADRLAADRLLGLARHAELRGDRPRGLFAHAGLGQDLGTVLAWRAALLEHSEGPVRRIHLGRAHEAAHVDAPRLPALELRCDSSAPAPASAPEDGSAPIEPVVYHLHGVTGLLAAGGRDLVALVDGHNPRILPRLRARLAGVIDHLLLSASDHPELAAPEGRRLLLLGVSAPRRPVDLQTPPPTDTLLADLGVDDLPRFVEILALAPLTPEAARAQLADLAAAIYSGPHDRLLPIDLVAELLSEDEGGLHLDTDPEAVAEAIDGLKTKIEDGRTRPRSAYGPVPDPLTYPFSAPDEAALAIARRFEPLLALAQPAAEAP